MKSLQAIVAGCVFIIIVLLCMQLLYIFLAVGYNALAKDYPFLHDISGSFRYIVGIPVFVIIMFAGGYITAILAGEGSDRTVWPQCMAVGLITAGGMIYSAMENASLTVTGIVIFVLALVATTAAGLYWQNDNKFRW